VTCAFEILLPSVCRQAPQAYNSAHAFAVARALTLEAEVTIWELVAEVQKDGQA